MEQRRKTFIHFVTALDGR